MGSIERSVRAWKSIVREKAAKANFVLKSEIVKVSPACKLVTE